MQRQPRSSVLPLPTPPFCTLLLTRKLHSQSNLTNRYVLQRPKFGSRKRRLCYTPPPSCNSNDNVLQLQVVPSLQIGAAEQQPCWPNPTVSSFNKYIITKAAMSLSLFLFAQKPRGTRAFQQLPAKLRMYTDILIFKSKDKIEDALSSTTCEPSALTHPPSPQ